MAILIPELPRDCTAGERQVFEKFERDLRDNPDWVVFHSLGLAEHEKKIWGEIDFVVLSTKGIFALEVKSGSVSCRDGKWIFGRGSRSYSKAESPWSQASSAMFALKRLLRQADPSLADLLMGFGVIMPHETFTATGPEIDQATLLDRRGFGRNLGFYIGQLQRHWDRVHLERHNKALALPSPEDIRRLRALIRPDFESTVTLGSELNALDQELIQLTNRQIRAARRMAANSRSLVRGRAGTGKTILAVERAKQLAADGRSVLFLCFNKFLARHIDINLAAAGFANRVVVRHIHSLFHEVICRAGLENRLQDANGSDEDLFGSVYPQLFVEAAIKLDLAPVDAIVVDEAQDILTPENLDALDILLKNGLRRGQWHLFLDPMQNIYEVHAPAVEERLQEIAVVYDDLFENCRNTREVTQQTSIISGIDMATEGAPSGPSCDCRFYADRADGLRLLDTEVRRLLAAGVASSEIVILSTKRRENSLVASMDELGGVAIRDLGAPDSSGGIAFATIHAFKGLERNVVIAIDLDDLGDPRVSMLHYAGLSRARTLLLPIVPNSARGPYSVQAAAYGRRLAESSAA